MLKYVEHMNKDEKTVLYVTRDLERALGIAPNSQYQIVTNRTPYSESIQAQFPGFIHFVESQEILHTYGLINQFNFDSLFKLSNLQSSNVAIVVFKNSSVIEILVRKKGLFLLNPSFELSEKIENKIFEVYEAELQKSGQSLDQMTIAKSSSTDYDSSDDDGRS
jgi:hypothetical protein